MATSGSTKFRCEDLKVSLLLRRYIRDVAAVREERVLALDNAKALQTVAEERGHRDAAVLDPAQCASWCFVLVVFLIVFLAAWLLFWGAPEQQTGQTRCGRLWWSWVQLPDRCFGVLVLVWFSKCLVALRPSGRSVRAM